MCVAYSSSAMKAWQDRRDQERFFDFDERTFFGQIGGTAQGAYVRAAMERMRTAGYPVAGSGDAGKHRIAAYYAVPRDLATIKAAIYDLGPVVISTPWYRSWFRPAAGVLPRPDTQVGGHAIVAYGWDARGLRLRNSWGGGQAEGHQEVADGQSRVGRPSLGHRCAHRLAGQGVLEVAQRTGRAAQRGLRPWRSISRRSTAARAKAPSSSPAGIDHLSMPLILCELGLTWPRRSSTAGE
jgi:hypothetical protein